MAKCRLILTLAAAIAAGWQTAAPPERDAVWAVPFNDVIVNNTFWTSWLEVNRRTTIPINFQMCEETGIIDNFSKAAGKMEGPERGILNSDEVVYKTIEAASFALASGFDAALDEKLDGIIARIAAAQEEDGYLNTHRTIRMRNGVPDTPERWPNLKNDLEL